MCVHVAPRTCTAVHTQYEYSVPHEPCNHVSELTRTGFAATNPCTAVVRVETAESLLDPTYALQILPHAVEVRGASIKELADGAAVALGAVEDDGVIGCREREMLAAATRGALATHVLVPDLLRGVPPARAKLGRRCNGVADKLGTILRRRFACARPSRSASDDAPAFASDAEPIALQLQLLLLEPELLVVSLARCAEHHSGIGRWPVPTIGGFSDCSLDGDMPSSACASASLERRLPAVLLQSRVLEVGAL